MFIPPSSSSSSLSLTFSHLSVPPLKISTNEIQNPFSQQKIALHKEHNNPTHQRAVTSKELKVSFQPPVVPSTVVEIVPDSTTATRRKYKGSSDEDEFPIPQQQHIRRSSNLGPDGGGGGGGGEVLKCSSNASFQRKSSLLRAKTRSRLMDPPEQAERKSDRVAKSGQLKSGLLAKAMDDEDDDPFLMEGDLPEEYKKANFSALTLVQWVSLVLILGALICSLSIPVLKRKSLWTLKLWKWEVLVLVLICGRLVSGWGIWIVVFFVERNFLLRKWVLYFVSGDFQWWD